MEVSELWTVTKYIKNKVRGVLKTSCHGPSNRYRQTIPKVLNDCLIKAQRRRVFQFGGENLSKWESTDLLAKVVSTI